MIKLKASLEGVKLQLGGAFMLENVFVIESDMVLLLPDQGLAQPVMASQMSHQSLWDSCVRHSMLEI